MKKEFGLDYASVEDRGHLGMLFTNCTNQEKQKHVWAFQILYEKVCTISKLRSLKPLFYSLTIVAPITIPIMQVSKNHTIKDLDWK